MKIFRKVVLSAVAAVGVAAASNYAQAQQDISVGAASNLGGMIVFVAQGKGFFAKHDLNAKVEVRNTGAALTKSLRAGDIDFAPAAFTNLPVALEKGLELRGVVGYLGAHYNKPTHDSNVGIIARPDTGIATVGDLQGKKVGVAFGTTGDFYLQEILKANGLTVDDIDRINVRPPDHVSTLDSGGIDVVVAWEPNVTRALDTVDGSTLVSRGGDYVCFCAIMHGLPETVDGNPERTQAFVDAMSEAAAWLRDPANVDEAAEIGSRFVRGMTADLVKRTIGFIVYDSRIGGGTAEAFNASVELLIAQEKMEAPYDPANYLETRYIDDTIKRHPEWFADLD